MNGQMRMYDIRDLLWESLFWLYAIFENVLSLPFIACSMVPSPFESITSFRKTLKSLHSQILSPWRSIFGLYIQQAIAHLVQVKNNLTPASLFGIAFQVAATLTATCIRIFKYDQAYEPASISRCFFRLGRWIKVRGDTPSTPFLASILWALPRVTSALPTGAIPKADDGASTEFLLTLLFCSACALIILVAGHFIAKRTGEMATHGIFMGIESMACWLSITDPNTSVLLLFTMLCLFTVSSYVFGHAAFDQWKIPKSSILYTLFLAGFLDISIVRMTTQVDAPLSQKDLLTPALLSMSVALYMTVVFDPMIRKMLRD